jgi:ABC-type transport system involved in cytochrome c biogenesis permease subunit
MLSYCPTLFKAPPPYQSLYQAVPEPGIHPDMFLDHPQSLHSTLLVFNSIRKPSCALPRGLCICSYLFRHALCLGRGAVFLLSLKISAQKSPWRSHSNSLLLFCFLFVSLLALPTLVALSCLFSYNLSSSVPPL